MTDEIRRALCKHNKDNPSLTQKQLQEWVHSNYGLQVSQATISNTVKRSLEYLSLAPERGDVKRHKPAKFPDLEKSLYEWILQYQEHVNMTDCEDNEEYFNHENDEEFTFMYLDENNTPISSNKALKNKDIHPIFPLFDQNLLSHEERKPLLSINPQVNKVFVESDQVALSSTSAYDRIESVAMGPYYTRKKQPPKLSKKSNSTCFPKLWRLKDKVGCSNSDGRDAFVFLKKHVRSAVEGSSLKGDGGKRKGLKAKNGRFLGHEINELVPSQAPLTEHCHQQMVVLD
ncbi:CENP-B homolog protein 2-like protein [Tanacetum coccineum]